VEGLADVAATPRQLALGGAGEEWRAAEQASDRAAARFGAGAVRPATLVDRADSPVDRE
jgi:DNA polymerase-4